VPTIISHAAVPLALAIGLGREAVPRRLAQLAVVASILPDLDVLSFGLGIPYEDALGHRGFTHSLAFAAMLALVAACTHRAFDATSTRAFWFVLLATASHGFLDAFTNGGLGVAFLWPFWEERYFAPVQMIQVSPIGRAFFSEYGLRVLLSELVWVWTPCARSLS
jgi:inner membrane protein